ANLLIMPSIDAANISFNLLKAASGGGVTLGPILLGVAKPVHILTQSTTVRRIVNMTALTVVDCAVQQQATLIWGRALARLRCRRGCFGRSATRRPLLRRLMRDVPDRSSARAVHSRI